MDLFSLNARKHIDLVVESAAIDFVADLEPDESVEHHCFQCDVVPTGEYSSSAESKKENDCELDNGLSENHFPHIEGNQG